MIVSVHLADVGWRAAPRILRANSSLAAIGGLRYAKTVLTAPLSENLLPSPRIGGVGLIASWDEDGALDQFSASHPLAEQLSGGWHVRLEPLHVYGAWSGMPDLPTQERPISDEEPVAVLTLGQLRLTRLAAFLRASSLAEGEAIADPGLLASTGLARPPRMLATFSLWQSAKAMRNYAHERSGGAHTAAVRAHKEQPFHHQSAFVRFRPYASVGRWEGRDPLAARLASAA